MSVNVTMRNPYMLCVIWALAVAVGLALTSAAAAAQITYLAHIREATDLLRRDLPRQAEEEFAAANLQDYADPQGWLGLGAARLAQGQVDQALEDFAQAAELALKGSTQSRSAVSLTRLGRSVCMIQRGQVMKAREELAALTQADFAAALPALAYAELAAGNREAARAQARLALARFPDDSLALMVLGKVSGAREGIPLMSRAVELCPGSRYAAPLSALALPNNPRTAPATADDKVRVEIEQGPRRRAVVTWLGPEEGIYVTLKFDGEELGMSNAAPHQFGLPRELGPGLHGLVAEVWSDGAVLGRRCMLLPGDVESQPSNHYSDAEYSAALDGLRAALTPIPNRVHLHYSLAAAYAATGQRVRALQNYERVVAMDPGFADARQRLIALCSALGRKGSTREISAVPGSKRICITFDDGPNPLLTERILGILRAAGVRATFFVVGTQARSHPELLRAIASAGHEIANHSYSHDDMARKSAAEVQQELLQTQVAVEDATGQRTRLFRPPGGSRSAEVRAAAAQIGYATVLWSANVGVCAGLPLKRGLARLLGDITPGAVVLLHNGPDETIEVLPGLLAALKKRGYSFVTMSQALGR
jgi:peptidoglycan/xylan/chitin deacetylase (PgdA/CDA1 family)